MLWALFFFLAYTFWRIFNGGLGRDHFSCVRFTLTLKRNKICTQKKKGEFITEIFFFSRNQLSYLPSSVCQLPNLQGLVVNNNRLVSLPEEIGRLGSLMELDASCNEITHLPVQIGDLAALRSLDLRRNHLQEVPVGEENIKRFINL